MAKEGRLAREQNEKSRPHLTAHLAKGKDGGNVPLAMESANSDRGSTRGNKLDYSRLVPAEGTHAARLQRSRRAIHFESVEYAVHGDSSSGVEQIAAKEANSLAKIHFGS